MQPGLNYLGTLSLIPRNLQPENKEVPIQFIESDLMDKTLFYRRNHFRYPKLSSSNYWLPIDGLVKTPKLLSLQEITTMPTKNIMVILECSGNKRNFFEPRVFGEQWEKGAINQGIWKGVPLKIILESAGIRTGAKEVVVEGYDYGRHPYFDKIYSFTRSLPLEKALHPDTLIAYEYNNQPIPFRHGYPLRLIVPQWYAMASVKWVKSINVIGSEYKGPFQSVDYVYYPNKENDNDAYPVREINVNSTIQKPLDMEILSPGKQIVKGIAWTGKGKISKVEISTDNGKTWGDTVINRHYIGGYGWFSWSYVWNIPHKGEYILLSKATDSFQRIQPSIPFWNRKGYGYHAMDKISVKIE